MILLDIWHDPVFQWSVGTILALLGIIVGAAVAIGVYRGQRSKKEISYEVISDASVISIDQKIASRVEVKLDGSPVKIVTLAVIKIRNSGNAAVKKDDYDEPIKIEFNGRKVISNEVVETEPAELIDPKIVNTFLPTPAPAQEYVEFPPYLLNPNQSITFSVLLDGPKGAISKRGRVVDGKVILFDPEKRHVVFNKFLGVLSTLYIIIGILFIIFDFLTFINGGRSISGRSISNDISISAFVMGISAFIIGMLILLVKRIRYEKSLS